LGIVITALVIHKLFGDVLKIKSHDELEEWNNTHSFNIIALSGWFLFVLVNAYYGGALTMFFTSLPYPKFTRSTDVVVDGAYDLVVSEVIK